MKTVLAKARGADAETIGTWSDRISEARENGAIDVLSKDVWEKCGLMHESVPEKSLAEKSVTFFKSSIERSEAS